jgi:quercetin dioxygenase-like cupin family protein
MHKGPSTNWIEVFPGVRRHRLVATIQTYQMEVLLATGSKVPLHKHPQEQITYVVRGRLRFQIGEETFEVGPGESALMPGDTPHALWTLEEALVIDTFVPARTDYLVADGD